MTDNKNEIPGIIATPTPSAFELTATAAKSGRGLTLNGVRQDMITSAVLTVPADGLPVLEVSRVALHGTAAGEAVVTAVTRLISRHGEDARWEEEPGNDMAYMTRLTAARHIPGSETLSGSCAVSVGGALRRARFMIVVSPDETLGDTRPADVIRVAHIEREIGIEGIQGGHLRARHDEPAEVDPAREAAIRSVLDSMAAQAVASDGDVWAGVTTMPGPFGDERYSYLIIPTDARGPVPAMPRYAAEILPSDVPAPDLIPVAGIWEPVFGLGDGEGQGEAQAEGEREAEADAAGQPEGGAL